MTIGFNKRECIKCHNTNWEWIDDNDNIETYRCEECGRYERVIRTATGRMYL